MKRISTPLQHRLLLIRHGESTWNVEHRLPGQLPGIKLTAQGREQAQRLAAALSELPLTAIISSPLERAVETAEFLAEGRELSIQLEPGLMDIELGHWSGQNRDSLFQSDPTWNAFVRNPTVAPPDVETFPQLEERAVTAVEGWLNKETTGAYPAFVTHSDVIKLLLSHYLGMDAGRARALRIDNASASIVELHAHLQPVVLTINWNPQPGWVHTSTSTPEKPQSEEHVVGE
jgi:broad specificity phosphatase PhoE